MDAARFDTLTRSIGSRTSRRVALGFVATGLLSIAAPDVEAARCSKQKLCPECKQCKRRRCKPDDTLSCSGGTCQGGNCIPTSGCTTHADCPGSLCSAPGGTCGGQCTTHDNCGGAACGVDSSNGGNNVCSCLNGACITCGSLERLCQGGCAPFDRCCPDDCVGVAGSGCNGASSCTCPDGETVCGDTCKVAC